MKKSLVAAGVIVALGVVWTGGAWFTGKQLEGRIADMVQQANAQLRSSAPESGLELSYQDYQRGLFSSHLQLVVKPIAGQANGWLAAGQSVVLDEVVDHGPFPLASLKAFNLAPAMASVHTTLVKNDASQALFEIAKGDTPFTVDTRIAYSGDSQSAIVLNALDYAKGDEKVTFSGGQFQLDADRDGKNISLKGQAGSGQIDALNEYNQKVQLRFVNLTTDGATELASFNERIGQQKMTLDKLAISVEGKELALIDGMALDGGSTLTQDGKGVNSQVNYTVNSLKLQGQDMGSGKLTLKVDNVDGQAWHQFSQQYSAQSQALLAKPELAQNPELYQPADAAKLADQQVKGLAAMGQMFRITTMEDNAISSSLQYANGQVTLNGQKMPLQDFAAMFGLEAPSLPDSAPQEGQPQQDDAAPQQDDAAPQP